LKKQEKLKNTTDTSNKQQKNNILPIKLESEFNDDFSNIDTQNADDH
jgi:hypothetical protein